MPGISNSTDRFNGVVTSLAIKVPCKVVSIVDLTLSGEQTVNGIAVVTGDRVLINAQTAGAENGIYDVKSTAWDRAADWDGNRDATERTIVLVGTAVPGANIMYQCDTTGNIVIGSTAVSFSIWLDPAAGSGGINAPLSYNFLYESSVAVSPPSGAFRLNNGNFAGASSLYIADIDSDGNDISAVLANMIHASQVRLYNPAVPGDYWIWSMELATPTDNGTYWTIGIDLAFGEVFPLIPNNTPMVLEFLYEPMIDRPAQSTSFGQIPYLDEGRYKGSSNTLIIDPRNGVSNGRIQSTATLGGQPQGAMCVMYGASAALQAMWYMEGATANNGHYGAGVLNQGLSGDRFEWGYDSATTDRIFYMTELLQLVVDADAGFFMEEKVADHGNVAGLGELWVRNDAPNVLVYTDDVGTDFVLNTGGAAFDPTADQVISGSWEFTNTGGLELGPNCELEFRNPADNSTTFLQALAGSFQWGIAGTGFGSDFMDFGSSFAYYRYNNEIRMQDNIAIDFGSGGSLDHSMSFNGTDFVWTGPVNSVALVSGFDQFRLAMTLGMNEQAAPDGNVAGVGQYWVRSSAPCRPEFRDDTNINQLLDPSISEIVSVVASRTGILSDKGKTVAFTGATAAQIMTIPANASVSYQIGTFLGFDNSGSVSHSIAITTDTLIFADDNSTGTRTLAAGGAAVAQKVGATTWKIAGAGLT